MITAMPRPVVAARGEFGDGLTELVTTKLAVVARHAHHPVLAVRVELDRHADPAVARPVAAKVSVDLNGRQVHAEAIGRTAREAVDRMVDRVVRQLDDRPRAPRRRRRAPTGTVR
jgi:ribosome-associated translation inhibitor RaiA